MAIPTHEVDRAGMFHPRHGFHTLYEADGIHYRCTCGFTTESHGNASDAEEEAAAHIGVVEGGAQVGGGTEVAVTPLAEELAEEEGLDAELVKPLEGRTTVVKADVQNAIDEEDDKTKKALAEQDVKDEEAGLEVEDSESTRVVETIPTAVELDAKEGVDRESAKKDRVSRESEETASGVKAPKANAAPDSQDEERESARAEDQQDVKDEKAGLTVEDSH